MIWLQSQLLLLFPWLSMLLPYHTHFYLRTLTLLCSLSPGTFLLSHFHLVSADMPRYLSWGRADAVTFCEARLHLVAIYNGLLPTLEWRLHAGFHWLIIIPAVLSSAYLSLTEHTGRTAESTLICNRDLSADGSVGQHAISMCYAYSIGNQLKTVAHFLSQGLWLNWMLKMLLRQLKAWTFQLAITNWNSKSKEAQQYFIPFTLFFSSLICLKERQRGSIPGLLPNAHDDSN